MASQHPAVQELDSLLHSLQSLKPPGVNKSKVDATSKLCLDLQNVSVRLGLGYPHSPHQAILSD
jgi:hypothetical protein